MSDSENILCTRCGKKGSKYLVGTIIEKKQPQTKTSSLIDWYRCMCNFCKSCLEQVQLDHPENIYMKSGDGTLDNIELQKEMIHKKQLLIDELKVKGMKAWTLKEINEFKSKFSK